MFTTLSVTLKELRFFCSHDAAKLSSASERFAAMRHAGFACQREKDCPVTEHACGTGKRWPGHKPGPSSACARRLLVNKISCSSEAALAIRVVAVIIADVSM